MIIPVNSIDIRFVPGQWPAPASLRDRVPEIWGWLSAKNPHLWDGRVLGVSAVVALVGSLGGLGTVILLLVQWRYGGPE